MISLRLTERNSFKNVPSPKPLKPFQHVFDFLAISCRPWRATTTPLLFPSRGRRIFRGRTITTNAAHLSSDRLLLQLSNHNPAPLSPYQLATTHNSMLSVLRQQFCSCCHVSLWPWLCNATDEISIFPFLYYSLLLNPSSFCPCDPTECDTWSVLVPRCIFIYFQLAAHWIVEIISHIFQENWHKSGLATSEVDQDAAFIYELKLTFGILCTTKTPFLETLSSYVWRALFARFPPRLPRTRFSVHFISCLYVPRMSSSNTAGFARHFSISISSFFCKESAIALCLSAWCEAMRCANRSCKECTDELAWSPKSCSKPWGVLGMGM